MGEKKLLKSLKTKLCAVYYDKKNEHWKKFEREEEEIKNISEDGLIDYEKRTRKIGVKEGKINKGLVKKTLF